MNALSSKISFYDFLNILVTGFLLLNLFCDITKSKNFDWIYLSISSFLVGLIYHQLLMECIIGKFIRNCKCIRLRTYAEVRNTVGFPPMPNNGKSAYLRAYYLVAKNNCLMNIPILEAHIAFVRNIWPILLLYLIALCVQCSPVKMLNELLGSCSVAIGIFIFLFVLPIVWYKLQSKVSYLVWEGAYFLQSINQESHEKNNSK